MRPELFSDNVEALNVQPMNLSDFIHGYESYLRHRVEQAIGLNEKDQRLVREQVLLIRDRIRRDISFLNSQLEEHSQREGFFREFPKFALYIFYFLRDSHDELLSRKKEMLHVGQLKKLNDLAELCDNILEDIPAIKSSYLDLNN